MPDTSGADKREGPGADNADLGRGFSRRPRSPNSNGGGSADREHPDDVWLSVEEHLAGLWDVLGVGDAEEEHEGEERKKDEEDREGGDQS